MTVISWYFGSWDSIYFHVLYWNSELQRFKIILKPDLSDVSLHVINMPEVIQDGYFILSLGPDTGRASEGLRCRICEDALVYSWDSPETCHWGTYTGLTSTPFINVISQWTWNASELGLCNVKSFCPASGRFVCFDESRRKVVDPF